MSEYEELLAKVSAMDAPTQKPSVKYVQMDVAAGEPLTVSSPRPYPSLLGEVSAFDKTLQSAKQKKPQRMAQMQKLIPAQFTGAQQKAHPAAPAAKEQAQPKKQQPPWTMPNLRMPTFRPAAEKVQPQPHPEETAVLPRFVHPPKPKPTAPEMKKAKEVVAVAKPVPLEDSASKELAKMIKKAKIAPPALPVERAYAKPPADLVLPNLSLTDQVSELDKIVENLQGSRFNEAQLEVVRKEVQGLSDFLSSHPEGGAGSAFDRALAELRKARLARAMTLISGL